MNTLNEISELQHEHQQQQQHLEEHSSRGQFNAIPKFLLDFQKTGIYSAELSSTSSSMNMVSMDIAEGHSDAPQSMSASNDSAQFRPYNKPTCTPGTVAHIVTHDHRKQHQHHEQQHQHNAEPWRPSSAFVVMPQSTTTTTTTTMTNCDSFGIPPGFVYSRYACPEPYGFFLPVTPNSRTIYDGPQQLAMMQYHHHHHQCEAQPMHNRSYNKAEEFMSGRALTAISETDSEVKPESARAVPIHYACRNLSVPPPPSEPPVLVVGMSEDSREDFIVDDATLGIVEYECGTQKEAATTSREEESSNRSPNSVQNYVDDKLAKNLKRQRRPTHSAPARTLPVAVQASSCESATDLAAELLLAIDNEDASVATDDTESSKSELLQALLCSSDAAISPDSSGTETLPVQDCPSKTNDESIQKTKTKKKNMKTRKKPIFVVKKHLLHYQLDALEAKFQENPFLSDAKARTALANEINLSEHKIGVWFQNRRTRERRIGRMPAGILPKNYDHKRYNMTIRK